MSIDLTTPAGIVDRGMMVMQSAEDKAEKLMTVIPKLGAVIDAGLQQGWIGKLEAGELKAEANAIAGIGAEALKRLYVLHRRCTDICVQNGVDVPQPLGGGTR